MIAGKKFFRKRSTASAAEKAPARHLAAFAAFAVEGGGVKSHDKRKGKDVAFIPFRISGQGKEKGRDARLRLRGGKTIRTLFFGEEGPIKKKGSWLQRGKEKRAQGGERKTITKGKKWQRL